MKRIKEISIMKLFGIFNHNIQIKETNNVSIIFSPNGFGKTHILNMLEYLFMDDFENLIKVKFDEMKISFQSGKELLIKREKLELGYEKNKISNYSLIFTTLSNQNVSYQFTLTDIQAETSILQYIDKFIVNLKREEENLWLDKTSGNKITLTDILEKYSNQIPLQLKLDLQYLINRFIPVWLQDLLDPIVIHHIDTQRLFTRNHTDDQPDLNVEKAANHLSQLINDIKDEAEILGSENESSFPFRLIDGLEIDMSLKELKTKIEYLSAKREELIESGILDAPREEKRKFKDLVDRIDDSNKAVLCLYTTDVEEKFIVFEDLLTKIQLFKNIIETQFTNKSLHFDKDKGFFVRVHNPKNREDIHDIEISMLSSGEQHLLILYFDLIFRAASKSIILVDEPEISIHVAWQLLFIENIERIAYLNNLSFFVATHSPQIINNSWDKTVDLSLEE